MRQAVKAVALAWVLWSKMVPLGSDDSKAEWQLLGATTLERVCRWEARWLQSQNIRPVTEGIRTFECLPDAVDPRPRR